MVVRVQQPIDWTPRTTGTRWSVEVRDTATTTPLLRMRERDLLQTASLGKLFILRRVAESLTKEPANHTTLLVKPQDHMVGDSGLWQHLQADALPIPDLAVLIASCSDNMASNALIDWLGLERVQQTAAEWVEGGSTLCDYYRDHRDDSHAPTVSRGSAGDYVRMILDVTLALTPELEVVRGWMSTSMDMSLVGAAAGIDPLSHYHPQGFNCVNKTGCDVGVRADVGVITSRQGALAYAAICNWELADEPSTTASVIDDMRRLGVALVDRLGGNSPGRPEWPGGAAVDGPSV